MSRKRDYKDNRPKKEIDEEKYEKKYRRPYEDGGAKYYKGENGKADFLSAWIFRSDIGTIKISGFLESEEIFKASNNADYVLMNFNVFYQSTGVTHQERAAYFYNSGKAHLPICNIYISTNSRREGGFCGFYRKEFSNYKPR